MNRSIEPRSYPARATRSRPGQKSFGWPEARSTPRTPASAATSAAAARHVLDEGLVDRVPARLGQPEDGERPLPLDPHTAHRTTPLRRGREYRPAQAQRLSCRGARIFPPRPKAFLPIPCRARSRTRIRPSLSTGGPRLTFAFYSP